MVSISKIFITQLKNQLNERNPVVKYGYRASYVQRIDVRAHAEN